MQITWLTKFSLIDYPGEIACIVFTPGCNFRCSYCHNSEFVLPEKIKNIDILKQKMFFNFLEKRKGLLTWVSICWWEPSLQKDLVSFCQEIKKMWFLVKLDTNGRDPDLLKELLDKKIVDYIAMDIKEDIDNFWKLSKTKEKPQKYIESINIIKNSNIDYEFRTTIVKWFHDVIMLENIAKMIKWSKNYYLQNFRTWNTLDRDFNWWKFSEKELLIFRDLVSKYVKNIWIRN